jgi:hypothetical protein
MKVPADLYARSARVYRGLEELTYPFHDQTIIRVWPHLLPRTHSELSQVFAG